ncbi:MAG: hypothetical protein Q8K02_03980, partial [Flavobacterium sp.]|nr:hypothetical protein [Flavobacterium sp.]
MSGNDRKNLVLNIRTILSNQWVYFAIFLFVFSYYYFFTEGLPWFWYDDIYWIEQAEKTPVLALIKSILDFTHGS